MPQNSQGMTTSPSSGLAGGLYVVGESERGKVGMLMARVSVGPFISPATLRLISSSRGGDASRLLKDAKAEAGLHPVCRAGGRQREQVLGMPHVTEAAVAFVHV